MSSITTDDSPQQYGLEDFPLLNSINTHKPTPISASSLLRTLKTAQSESNPFKTLSEPIDSLIGPILRPGYALQISSPPGLYVEQLLLGLIKNVTRRDKGVMVIDSDMQNKLIPAVIFNALNQGHFQKVYYEACCLTSQPKDDRSKKVYYQKCFLPNELISTLNGLPDFIQTHPDLSLLILSSISFPLHTESNYSKRNKLIEQIRELIVKLCKNLNIAIVITSNMSTQFANPDGSKGTFDNDTTGILIPQINLSCTAISSLVLSRTSRTSGQATLTTASKPKQSIEFHYSGLEFR